MNFKRVYGTDAIGNRELKYYECIENPRITIKVQRGGGWYGGQERIVGYTVKYDDKTTFTNSICTYMTLSEAKQMVEYWFGKMNKQKESEEAIIEMTIYGGKRNGQREIYAKCADMKEANRKMGQLFDEYKSKPNYEVNWKGTRTIEVWHGPSFSGYDFQIVTNK